MFLRCEAWEHFLCCVLCILLTLLVSPCFSGSLAALVVGALLRKGG